ncbi:hypothetical protein AGABI1DRAFT_116362 [Agaricus bisporus var. burnettii JB137-S8]|uniref:PEBP-like protein n=1 Tax=Agaricus bisporus var. burnettii (strain JB137-S8 / ATCC MYA-4627 / FGSC 10392) TaxID=597362 RepID=K5WY53_AGABU|nr:uncharacterized protein AGABI1DRAFT_116362 [Agaricus bisporus var. burnettii JB137-S8]EKM75532.1 hypothetical protein AGABI1DRAFT_116362 [Agaricus bisporus var. burnettii JB137-S8]
MRLSLSFSFLSLFVLAIKAQDRDLGVVKRAFEAADIPADLSLNFNPTALLEVTFPESDGNDITIHAGQQVPRDSTAGPPIYHAVGLRSSGPFVITMVDPDAPTPQMPTVAQERHFLGGDFHLDRTGRLTNSTAGIDEFLQPSPPAGSDAHRYIFMLWNQPRGFDQQTVVGADTPRGSFNVSEFARAVGLGEPIAGTFLFVAPNA